jgi:DNA-binding MarR family transcriptional regulator
MSDYESFSDLNRLIHEPGRLAIVAVLNAVDQADFLFLLNQTGLTRGNLSSHTAKLETAGYITIEKAFVEKVPRTVYRLTAAGRDALSRYRTHMGRVLETFND